MLSIHILGICGTFMSSLAILATKMGFLVTGQDSNYYPPMSTQLANNNITVIDNYSIADLPSDINLIVIGNVMKRGMPIIEHILNQKIPFISGPEFLAKYVLKKQHVLAVTGTHGKTTTASILAWILQVAGLEPGYLIGGIPNNFNVSAKLGAGRVFVVEGDEYDSAFFDKNSKFLHYLPKTLIINNIEYDHADIFPDLLAIKTQFHYLIKTIPSNGLIVYPTNDINVKQTIQLGCWTPTQDFDLQHGYWNESHLNNYNLSALPGKHNRMNALAAIAAANHVGVPIKIAHKALASFKGVKRRLEVKGTFKHASFYSDFAHHPTAIEATIEALQEQLFKLNNQQAHRIIVVIDIASNTMKSGIHQVKLATAVTKANLVYFYYKNSLAWDPNLLWKQINKPGGVFTNLDNLIDNLLSRLQFNDQVLVMSNSSFANELCDPLMATSIG